METTHGLSRSGWMTPLSQMNGSKPVYVDKSRILLIKSPVKTADNLIVYIIARISSALKYDFQEIVKPLSSLPSVVLGSPRTLRASLI